MTLIRHQAIEALTRWKQAQLRESTHLDTPQNGFHLPVGIYNAMLMPEGKRYGYDFIIRNEQGSMVLAKNRCMKGSQDVFTAEAMGCREAMTWLMAYMHGFTKVQVESHCLLLTTAISSSTPHLSAATRLTVRDCWEKYQIAR